MKDKEGSVDIYFTEWVVLLSIIASDIIKRLSVGGLLNKFHTT